MKIERFDLSCGDGGMYHEASSCGEYMFSSDVISLLAYDEAVERDMFEVYAKTVNQGVNLKIYTVEEGSKGVFVNYQDIGVQQSWMTWKACAKSRARSAE